MADTFVEFKDSLPAYVRNEDDFKLFTIRHTAEHVLTQAMLNLYGKDKVIMAMGPATEDGFYFDFEPKNGFKLSEDDFEKIEAEMQKIISMSLPITKKELSLDEARNLFEDNAYKLEWINEIEDKNVKLTVYYTGEQFWDLCKGPHVSNTNEIKAFKLLNIAGAYWHGDENNIMLTRVYATAFDSKEKLEKFMWQREEAKKRDHRKLGKELDLFTFSELVGSGLPLYTQRGAWIRRQLNNYIEELQAAEGYEQVWTPQVTRAELFKKSGHYDKYKDDMFRVISNYSDEEMFLKPMNCPNHTQIYASQMRSYKDLPIKMTDFAMLYRDEKPGELLGLARVRSFSTDDCHIFCTEDQVDKEIDIMLQMTKKVMDTVGFTSYKYRLSTRDPQNPGKYHGDPAVWDKVEKWAEEIMKRNNIEYFDGPGEAAFYAPKMDLIATDSLGREWQLSTVQIDYVQPERFGLKYVDKDGVEKTPVMIHRAILGSAERMFMILLENTAGAFPAWLSPEQVAVIPIGEQNFDYAKKIGDKLKDSGIRSEIYMDSDRMQNKIRKAQAKKIPYMFIVGKREEEANTVSLRYRTGEEQQGQDLDETINKISVNIKSRKLDITL